MDFSFQWITCNMCGYTCIYVLTTVYFNLRERCALSLKGGGTSFLDTCVDAHVYSSNHMLPNMGTRARTLPCKGGGM